MMASTIFWLHTLYYRLSGVLIYLSLRTFFYVFAKLAIFEEMAIPVGLEPTTYCLEGSCSIRLSYGTAPKNNIGVL